MGSTEEMSKRKSKSSQDSNNGFKMKEGENNMMLQEIQINKD